MTLVCFECSSGGKLHDHHVVPKSMGGKRTVPLCERCHGFVHHRTMNTATLTIRAMNKLRRSNRRISSRIPFGYDLTSDGRRLQRNAIEQLVIKRIVRLRANGYSFQVIVDEMHHRGHKTKGGGKWHCSTVRSILSARNKRILARNAEN